MPITLPWNAAPARWPAASDDAPQPPLARTLRRAAALLAVALLFAAGWAFLAQAHALLWQRLPAGSIDRFVADRIPAPLPRPAGLAALGQACAQAPQGWQTWRRATWRQALARCLDDPRLQAQAETAQTAVKGFEAQIQGQLQAAEAWLAAFDAEHRPLAEALSQELADARQQPGILTPLAQAALALRAQLGLPAATSPREAVGRSEPVDRAARALRARVDSTRTQLQAWLPLPLAERLPRLALMAAGLSLEHDHGVYPPAPQLTPDRGSLAEALEWQRKAQGFQQRGFSLPALQALPGVLMLSAVLVLGVSLWAGRLRAAPLLAWTAASLLLGAGALILTDLALTGEPALRYLAERQFIRFGLGDQSVPLSLPLPPALAASLGVPALWWPLLALVPLLALLGRLRDGRSVWLAPVHGWVQASADPRWGWLTLLALVAFGAGAVLFLGMPAAVSEGLILLGALGLATYVARQAPLANTLDSVQWHHLLIAGLAVLAGLAGSVLRGDLGHALVALALALAFLVLMGGRATRLGLWLALVLGLALLASSLWQGHAVAPLAWLTERLPPHAQDRMLALFEPFTASASDLARVRWLMASAGAEGWGPGYVPWQGLAPGAAHQGLPLQGPSDYVLALAVAQWGAWGGVALVAAPLLLLAASGAAGLHTALRPGQGMGVRFLAALGAWGCLMMAFKVLLSLGGVAGVLPLTGLPVALLGYGPVTHAAALFYLALVWGTAAVVPAQPAALLIQPAQRGAGPVRRRLAFVAAAALLLLLLFLAGSLALLLQSLPAQSAVHVSSTRLQMARALTAALTEAPPDATTAPADGAAGSPLCPELEGAIQAWNRELAALRQAVRLAAKGAQPVHALRVDSQRLASQLTPEDSSACRRTARTLGRMLATDLPRLIGAQRAHEALSPDPLAAFEPPRQVGPRQGDYSTPDLWWGLPGSLQAPQTLPQDPWLQRELEPRLAQALRQPARQVSVNHRSVAQGPALALTLDARLQPALQRLAECYAGQRHGADCEAVAPAQAEARSRYFEGGLRAGAIGVMVADVDTGRIVAMAGAVSDCSFSQLSQAATRDAKGQLPALRAGQACAQLPDRRSAFVAHQHPALWMVPPGSALKMLAYGAGVDRSLVPLADDGRWTSILARSEERLPVQDLALAAGPSYLALLHGLGFGAPLPDLLWGGAERTATAAAPASPAARGGWQRWQAERFAGTAGLRPTGMSLAQAERIRAEKQAGINVDQLYGAAAMTEFLAARRLADAAVGGGDVRVNALGLLSIWQALDRRARGLPDAPELHLLEAGQQAVPRRPVDQLSPAAARRTLAVTAGVSASAWQGTAQGSCRRVFGQCPADGLPRLSGKTGSADFLEHEDGPTVKAGQQWPSKLFGGVFTGADGRRYAVAAMALRVRQGDSSTLELSSSAPAEAAFTAARLLGVAGRAP
ncbi:MAG: FtsW/RodA/SpoVE family cell cycle protein [Rubrivivax sp.]|nr:FtsW/RodA/SpoVE family cell cycle protein [Rubrivivax sp.]